MNNIAITIIGIGLILVSLTQWILGITISRQFQQLILLKKEVDQLKRVNSIANTYTYYPYSSLQFREVDEEDKDS